MPKTPKAATPQCYPALGRDSKPGSDIKVEAPVRGGDHAERGAAGVVRKRLCCYKPRHSRRAYCVRECEG